MLLEWWSKRLFTTGISGARGDDFHMRKFHIGAIGLGIALLIFLIWHIGPAALLRDLKLLGWGFVPFVLIEGVAKVLHTAGWRFCLSKPYRSMGFFRILGIDFAGHSINYFTPTATIGGEVVRGSLLYTAHKGPEAVAGVAIGKITLVLSQIILSSAGAMFFIARIPLPPSGYIVAISVNLLILGGIVGFLLVQKHGRLGAVVRWLAARGIGGRAMIKATDRITHVDRMFVAFYRRHPGRFFLSMLFHFAAMFVGIIRTWYFLWLLTGGSLYNAAGIWMLATWLDILTFPIPLEIGMQESIRVLAFSALNYTPSLGLTFGIALRLEQIIWGGIGLLAYALLFKHVEGLPGRKRMKSTGNDF